MGKLGLFKKLKSGKIFEEEGLENYFKKNQRWRNERKSRGQKVAMQNI